MWIVCVGIVFTSLIWIFTVSTLRVCKFRQWWGESIAQAASHTQLKLMMMMSCVILMWHVANFKLNSQLACQLIEIFGFFLAKTLLKTCWKSKGNWNVSFAEKLSKDLILRCQLAERKKEKNLAFYLLQTLPVRIVGPDSRQVALPAAAHNVKSVFFGLAVSQFVKLKTKFFKPKKKIKRGCTSLEHMLNLQFRPDLLPSERVGERERERESSLCAISSLNCFQIEYSWVDSRIAFE